MIKAQINQSRLSGGQRYPAPLLLKTVRAVDAVIGKRTYDVSIGFVSPQIMRRTNRIYRGKDQVTDVLSFALDERSGELLLCYERASRQAKEIGHSTRSELTFLIIHGILHLFGYDHERPAEAKKMFALQDKILARV